MTAASYELVSDPRTAGIGCRHPALDRGSVTTRSPPTDRAPDCGGYPPIETDGGSAAGRTGLVPYTDAVAYRIDYPEDWNAVPEPDDGVAFEPGGGRSAGVVVAVEPVGETDGGERSLSVAVERFLDGLDADEAIRELRLLERTTARFPGGRRDVIEFAYVGDDPGERWRGTYCFVVAEEIAYTVGIDWRATEEFDAVARAIVDSFALVNDG